MQKDTERFSDAFEVIVSHPAKQGNIYERPLAAQRHGIPVKFLTGLYYKPEQFPYSLVRFLPRDRGAAVLRQLEKRRLVELNPDSVISLGGPWLETLLRPFSLFPQWWMAHDWLAARWLRHWKPSGAALVHCFDGSAQHTMAVAKQKGLTTVYEITLPVVANELFKKEIQEIGMSRDGSSFLPEWWLKHLIEECKSADYLLAQSNLTTEHLLQCGIAPNRIILLPLGVDTSRFQPAFSKDPDRPFRALFVGQLGVRKGLHNLLEAWKQLALRNAELLLAGAINKIEFGPEILERYKGIYHWLGFVDAQLPKVYQDCDIFILPSLAEGAALVMHEAMASGLPCIVTTNVGCTLRDGIEGFVIPVGDVDALKDRILRFYSNPELCRTMGIAARKRAEQFTWQEYGRRLALAYQIIAKGGLRSSTEYLDMLKLQD